MIRKQNDEHLRKVSPSGPMSLYDNLYLKKPLRFTSLPELSPEDMDDFPKTDVSLYPIINDDEPKPLLFPHLVEDVFVPIQRSNSLSEALEQIRVLEAQDGCSNNLSCLSFNSSGFREHNQEPIVHTVEITDSSRGLELPSRADVFRNLHVEPRSRERQHQTRSMQREQSISDERLLAILSGALIDEDFIQRQKSILSGLDSASQDLDESTVSSASASSGQGQETEFPRLEHIAPTKRTTASKCQIDPRSMSNPRKQTLTSTLRRYTIEDLESGKAITPGLQRVLHRRTGLIAGNAVDNVDNCITPALQRVMDRRITMPNVNKEYTASDGRANRLPPLTRLSSSVSAVSSQSV